VHTNESAWIERFASHLKHERRMSAHTIAAYRGDLACLGAFCDARRIERWSDLDGAQVRTFAASDHARGLGARSIQRRLSALRTFYEFLMREGCCTRNPAQDVPAPKQKKRLPTTLDADQMGRLLSFRSDDSLSARDKAIMELLYSSGLRLAELVNVDVASIDLADRTVRVLGKGAKSRVLPIGRYAVAALRSWLKERAALLAERRDPEGGIGARQGAVFV
jgi:integrase/recombinase XerC